MYVPANTFKNFNRPLSWGIVSRRELGAKAFLFIMSLDEAKVLALRKVQKHITIARGFNDPIELGDTSPELLKLCKSIESELQLLNIKIDLFFNKQS